MIWFACKQCRKTQGRPDSSAGMMVFCDCGYGNRVPWESTAAEPILEEAEPVWVSARPVDPPILIPLESEPERQPNRKSVHDPVPNKQSRRASRRKLNPSYCVNHPSDASTKLCADCSNGFCDSCTLTFQESTLCGPCKNFRTRRMQPLDRIAPLASFCLILGLIGGPISICLSLLGVHLQSTGDGSLILTIILCIFSALIPSAGLVTTQLALRQIKAKPRFGGIPIALTGSVISLVGLLWPVTVVVLMIAKM